MALSRMTWGYGHKRVETSPLIETGTDFYSQTRA